MAAPMQTPPSFAMASLLVAGGGATGSWLRLVTGRLWTMAIGPIAASAFPYGTLTVNIVGSLLMGVLVGWMARHSGGGESWRLLLGVGVLGGFTTFSAFSLDALGLWQRGQHAGAAAYVAVSVGLSLAAVGGVVYSFGGYTNWPGKETGCWGG